MIGKSKISLFFLIFLFFFENFLFLNYLVLTRSKGSILSYSTTGSDGCSLSCQKMMDEKISRALTRISGSKKTTFDIHYIPLGDGGETISRDWVVVEGSGFVFDLSDYPSGAKVYWEGNLKARDSNSRCYARIYDKNHFREVDFSKQSTSKTSFEYLTSQALSIWAGKNHYQIEVKSLNGIICYLESPKLIVKY